MKKKLKNIGKISFLLLLCANISIVAQDKPISGNISSESDGPLPGANVTIKGETIGTIADADGNYTLVVPSGHNTMVFTFIGYETQEVLINQRTTIDVVLIPSSVELSEVAVIGYGTQKVKDLTGAVAHISSEELSRNAVTSIDQALVGLRPGITVTNNSGDPGSGVSVMIRGVGTVNSTEPLYVIDGVPIINNSGSEIPAAGVGKRSNPMANINPNDIESITVLKDASAAAIYGVRGANGVIIVTTKKGVVGRPVVTFETYFGANQVGKIDLLKARDYADLMIEMYDNAGTEIDPDTQTGPYNLLDDSYVVDRADWQDAYFKTGFIQNYHLGVSGGSNHSDYHAAAGYYKNTATNVGSGMERFSFQLNMNQRIGRVTVGESVSFSRAVNRRVSFVAARSPIRILAEMAPTIPVYNPDNEGGYAGPEEGDGFGRWNPVGLAELTEHYMYRNRLIGRVFAEWEIVDGLKYKINLGADVGLHNGSNFLPSYYFGQGQYNLDPDLTNYSSNEISPLIENTLSYSNNFGDHNITVMAGYSQQSYTFKQFYAFTDALQSNEKQTLNTARTDGDISIAGIEDAWAIQSIIGRLNYGFRDKYLLTASFRRDGSSRFASDNRWGTFPSFSAGWRISEESFMSNVDFVNDLKLRAGYGQIGNQEVPPYSFESTLITYASYPFGGALQPGITQASLANIDLRWEITSQTNIGLDAGFFGGKTQLTLDYFIRNTDDMILQAPVPGSTGITDANAPYVNAGSVTNQGLEVYLAYNKSEGEFHYSLGGTFTYLHNEVTSLGIGNPIEGRFPDADGEVLTITQEGSPIGSFIGFRTDGIFQDQEEIDSHATQEGAEPGDFRFKDLTGDGVVNSEDREILGSPIPKYTYGITFASDFKGFDLSVFIQGVSGVSIYNGLRYWTEGMAQVYNHSTVVMDRWTGPNTSNTLPRAILDDPAFNRRPSDRFLENGSYIRLKNVTLGYSLPSKILGSVISGIRVYVTGQNLFTITDYSGHDPEIGTGFYMGGGTANQGVDYGIQPQPRSILAGIRMTF